MRNLKNRNNKGITLVALVITIIILLILVGISIVQLIGNGLFEKAKIAKNVSENAQIKEEMTLSDYENEIEEYVGATRNSSGYSITTLGESIGKTPIIIDATKYDVLYIETIGPDQEHVFYYIPTFKLIDNTIQYVGNGAHSGANGCWSSIRVCNTEVKLERINIDSKEYTQNSKIEVYGIKY